MANEDTDKSLKELSSDDAPQETKRPTITPHENDVVSGRGSGANRHVGNAKFRELVRDNKALYMRLTKHEKMSVARTILAKISSRAPPGRFLQKNPETFQWFEIGQSRALEKISQALREKTHQPVQDKIPQCQTSRPQDFWANGIYRRSTEDEAMLPLHLRNDGHRPASNYVENHLSDPSNSAKEMPRFNSGMASIKNHRSSLRQDCHHKLTSMRRHDSSNQKYCDTHRYEYSHKPQRNESGAFESMISLKMPPRIYDRGQSFSAMYPSQVPGDRMPSKYSSAINAGSMHLSLGRRQVWPTPQLRGRHDVPRCHPFPPLPQPPLPPKLSDSDFTKNHSQTLHGRESWNRNSTFPGRSVTLPSKADSYLPNRTSPSLRMRLPVPSALTFNALNTHKHKRPPPLLVPHCNDLNTYARKRGVQKETLENPRKRPSSFPPTNESKRICVNAEDVHSHNVVSSESNDEETVSTQPLCNDSINSSKTNSPSSSNGSSEGGNPKAIGNLFESSGLLALSTAAFMHDQDRETTPS